MNYQMERDSFIKKILFFNKISPSKKKVEKTNFSLNWSINDCIKLSEKIVIKQGWKDHIYKKFLIWETSGYNISSAKLRVIGDVSWF